MDHFRALRLALYFILGLVLGGGSMLAWADTYGIQHYYTTGSVGGQFGSAQEAGEAGCLAIYNLGGLDRLDGPYGSEPSQQWLAYCWNNADHTTSVMQSNATVRSNAFCPYGGSVTLVGGTYQCTNAPACEAGTVRNTETGACESTCEAGKVHGSDGTGFDVVSRPAGAVCIQGCQASYTASVCASGGGSEACAVWGPFVQSGQPCTTEPETSAAPSACPAGKLPGEVNGVTVCVTPGAEAVTSSKETSTETATKTNPDGTTGTTEKTTTTECNDGICTTTVTEGNSGGGAGAVIGGTSSGTDGTIGGGAEGTTTGTVTQSQSDYCTKNPTATGCGSKGSFTGNCSAGYSCSGDAIQCATAKAIYEQNCNVENAATALGGLANESTGFTDAQVASAKGEGESGTFDIAARFSEAQQTYVDYAKSCTSVFTVVFMGRTINVDIGFLCAYGQFLSVMVHIFAYLAVLRIMNQAFGAM